jgi:hypothetical protein
VRSLSLVLRPGHAAHAASFGSRARPDCQRLELALKAASRRVLRPFGVFNTGKLLAPGLPRQATSVLGLSRPLDVFFLLVPIRPCFVPDPPLGFLSPPSPLTSGSTTFRPSRLGFVSSDVTPRSLDLGPPRLASMATRHER